MIVLRDISTDGRYIGLLVLLWSLPMSTILLIMLPKVVAFHKGADGMSRSERTRGCSSAGGVRVTGISANIAETAERVNNETRKNPSSQIHSKNASSLSDGSEFAEE